MKKRKNRPVYWGTTFGVTALSMFIAIVGFMMISMISNPSQAGSRRPPVSGFVPAYDICNLETDNENNSNINDVYWTKSV